MIYIKFGLRKVILLLLAVLSVWYILSPFVFRTGGVSVVSIDEDANCNNLDIGDRITRIEGKSIESVLDFENVLSSISSGSHVTMIVDGGPGSCSVLEDGNLGVEVSGGSDRGLEFGTDIVGGEKITLSSNGGLSQTDSLYISEVIESRILKTDMKDSRVDVENNNIVIYADDSSGLVDLIINGKIECIIEQAILLSNGTGVLKVGDKSFDTESDGTSFILEGTDYSIDDIAIVDGVGFKIMNITNESVIVGGVVFDNNDIQTLESSVGYVNYDSSRRQYQFSIPIYVSQEAGIKFSKITEGLAAVYGSGVDIVDGMLVYYLDGEEITRLTIPLDMAGTEIETISIVGGTDSMEEAVKKKLLFDIALEGEIEQNLSIESIEEFNGTMEYMPMFFFISMSSLVILMFALLLVRYRKVRISCLGALIVVLEVFYVFGLVAFSQAIVSPGVVIDSILLVAVLVFLVLSMIQIVAVSEKSVKGKIMKLEKKFVISIFVLGFLMLFTPLNKLGIVLIIGQCISVLFTKPFYVELLRSD